MDAPKISVLIPLYNRKHYISQTIDSVLNQTFTDFEIIVRDNDSTDGSAEFVEERYAEQISSGKIKLYRNEENIGEFPNDNRLIKDATGKYLMILHSDDFIMPNALEHMFTVAEEYQADVVHSSKFFGTSHEGSIDNPASLKLKPCDKSPVTEITVMPDEPIKRFNQWMYRGTFSDAQYNIFNRKFFIDNDLRFETFGYNTFLALKWIIKAKILVKTPEPFYVHRNAPDSETRVQVPSERLARIISGQIKLSRHLNEFFANDEFFKDKPDLQYLAMTKLFSDFELFWVHRRGVYKNGITLELHKAVEDAFRKHFGDSAAFPAFLYHWIHAKICDKRVNRIISPPPHAILFKRLDSGGGLRKNFPSKFTAGFFFAIMSKIFERK